MAPFEPERFGFLRIDYAPSGLAFYEYRCHDAVDGRTDFLRLNIYLSRDGDFTCISSGLIEPFMSELMFELPPRWVAFDAHASLAHLDLTPAYNGTCLVDRAAYFRSQLPNTRFTSPATSSRHAARLWPVANNAS